MFNLKRKKERKKDLLNYKSFAAKLAKVTGGSGFRTAALWRKDKKKRLPHLLNYKTLQAKLVKVTGGSGFRTAALRNILP